MESARLHKKIRLALLVLIISLCLWLGKNFDLNVESFQVYFQRFPLPLAALIFVGVYSFSTFFLWFVKDILRLAAIYIFGIPVSVLLMSLGEMCNAIVLFHTSRYLGKDYVEKKLKGRFAAFHEKLGQFSFLELFLLRAVVLIPYRFMDLAAGLTKLQFRKYFAAVVLGTPFRISFQQYFWGILGVSLFKNLNLGVDYFTDHPLSAVAVLGYAGLTGWTLLKFKNRIS